MTRSRGRAGARPCGGDGVEAEGHRGVADRVVVQLKARRGGCDRDGDEPVRFPDGVAAEPGAIGIGLGEAAGVRLDHTVGEELDGGGAQERARAAGPLLDRGGDLLVDVAVGLKGQRQQAPHVELAAFVEQAVGRGGRLARGDPRLVYRRQAVTRRDRLLEVPQAGQARLDIVVGERPLHPGPRFAQQARGGAVGQTLDHGPTPLGRGGILAQTDEPQRRRVQPLRVLTVVDEAHWPVGHHPVEHRRRHLALGQARRVPAKAAHDDDGRVSGDEAGHGVEAAAQRVAVREIDLEELARRVTGVQMGIDEARQHQPTAEIDDLRARPPLLGNDLRPAHRDDASMGDRQSGVPRATGVDGVDDAVRKDQIGGHGTLLVGGSAGPASPILRPALFITARRARRRVRHAP